MVVIVIVWSPSLPAGRLERPARYRLGEALSQALKSGGLVEGDRGRSSRWRLGGQRHHPSGLPVPLGEEGRGLPGGRVVPAVPPEGVSRARTNVRLAAGQRHGVQRAGDGAAADLVDALAEAADVRTVSAGLWSSGFRRLDAGCEGGHSLVSPVPTGRHRLVHDAGPLFCRSLIRSSPLEYIMRLLATQ